MDSDDGVHDFLSRVKELGDKRDREDEERARKLEEEILAGRQARRARRDERAKSLSPRKDSPSSNLRSSRYAVLSEIDLSRLRDIDTENSRYKREDAVNDALEKLTGKSSKENADSREVPLLEPTLPWLKRPDSRGSLNSEPTRRSGSQSPAPDSDNEFRRSQIARNLGSKDISFFKQTADRKVSSDVLLKGSETGMGTTSKMALHGMGTNGNGSKRSAEKGPVPETSKGSVNYRAHRATLSVSHPYSALSKHNLFPTTNAMRFDPALAGRDTSSTEDEARQPAMSPSQGRISPERKTPSAAKNMGSFVQSAMLKREGSISKRWSASSPGPIGSTRTASPSPFASSRARDSSSSLGYSRESSPVGEDAPATPEPVKKETISRGRAKSIVESLSKYSTSGIHPSLSDSPKLDTTPPATPFTPSKTGDQKRWSPSKASWLEVALKKGSESGSPIVSKNTPSMEAVRDPPSQAHSKQSDSRPPVLPKPANLPSRTVLDNALNLSSTSVALNKATSIPVHEPEKLPVAEKSPIMSKQPPPVSEKPSALISRPISGLKVELDFRGNLKRRGSPKGSPEKEDLPFLSAMTRLRSTKTQNYVPPNELKERILAGKAALQEVGPPKPKPPDPVKERLLAAKGSLRLSSSSLPSISTLADVPLKSRPPPPAKHITAPARVEAEQPSSLAAKVAPNLANLLAKGPPSAKSSREFLGTVTNTLQSSSSVPEKRQDHNGGDGPLIHMTKTRAKGPKRRQPTTVTNSGNKANVEPIESAPLKLSTMEKVEEFELAAPKSSLSPKVDFIEPASPTLSAPAKSETIGSAPLKKVPPVPKRIPSIELRAESNLTRQLPPKLQEQKLEYKPPSVSDEQEKPKIKPPTPAKSPLLTAKTSFSNLQATSPTSSPSVERPGYSFSLEDQNSATAPDPAPEAPVPDPPTPTERPVQPPPLGWLARRGTSARAASMQRTAAVNKVPQAVSEEKAIEKTNIPKSQSTHTKLPPRLPTVEDEDDISDLKSSSQTTPLPPSVTNNKVRENLTVEDAVRKVSYGSIPNFSNELNAFFKDPELVNTKITFEMGNYLPRKLLSVGQRNTVKFDTWEVTSEGKVQSLDVGKVHILFDENMYMCLHVFEDESKQQGAEVFLWSGNNVSTTATGDAQAFAKKMAEENDAKMILLSQGHETPEFLDALGGFLITRRGSSKSGGSFPYMLCGRALHGGVAFDEEDMKAPCLCSGFPYLINTGQALYLWKGKGASSVELEYAWRVANGLTSEPIEEVDEDSEPSALLGLLNSGSEGKAEAKYWAMKPSQSNYTARLFKVDGQATSNVTEISPFNQFDIQLANIYVLDAFFELYIVIGANSQSKRRDFHTALQFTQEYSKAAQAMEGRPFLPPTFVLLEGVSKEFRAVFRSWQPHRIPTKWMPSRKPSLRVVEASDAMKAMKMAE